jgi:Holliday junction DNA helicase RuvA
MITGIRGRLTSIEGLAAQVALDSGLTYEVLVPGFLADRLRERLGQPVALATLEYLEPVGGGTSFTPRLVGFETYEQRRFLELMTTCKGMGTRKALRSMTIEPAHIASMIASADTKALQGLPEIGKRLAETIVAELREKVAPYATLDSIVGEPKRPGTTLKGAWGESVAALVALGQSPADAEDRIRAVQARHPDLDQTDAIVGAAFGRE